MRKILVAGSYNASMTVVSPALPRTGETVLGTSYFAGPGGKGANQAIGAIRLGADTAFLVKLGSDGFGAEAERLLTGEGLPAAAILHEPGTATGVALIMVDDQGNNQISVAPGANAQLTAADAPAALLAEVGVLLCQLECPAELFETLARSLPGATKILNPAPAAPLDDSCCQLADFLTPNESELATLTGLPVGTDEQIQAAATALLSRGAGHVIATLGERGAVWFHGAEVRHFPSPAVPVVDTTGAGDAFNAGLAAGLARGWPVAEATELAVRCGAHCVTRRGVIDGLPRSADLSWPIEAPG